MGWPVCGKSRASSNVYLGHWEPTVLGNPVHPDGRFLFVAMPSAAQDDPYGGLYRFKVVVNWITEVEERVPAP